MKSLRLAALAAALTLAACSSGPTDPAQLDPAAPSFDAASGMAGSGNGVGTAGSGGGTGSTTTQDGGNMVGSGNMSSDSTGTGTERGGGSLGSGN